MTTQTAVAPATPARVKKLRKRGWLKWIVWLAIGAALAAALVVARGRAGTGDVTTVQVAAVQRGTVRDYVTSTSAGRVSAKTEATLRAEIIGKVRTVHKKRGDKVLAGEAIVTYDADELGDRLRLAQVAVGLAQAQVKQAESNAALTETNLSRARRLQQSGSIANAEVENLEGQSAVLGRAIDAAHAGVAQASANVELARTALSKAVVRAPFAGTLLTVTVEVGETTSPGAPIAQLADTGELHVDAEIDESDVGRLVLGMPADVTLDAFPGERIRGKLTDIAPSVSRDLRGGRSVQVEVGLPQDPRLRVGMSADVDVIVRTQDATLFVPPNAVVGRGTDRSVYLVQGGVAHKRSIDVGISTWEAVEVKSGLAEGDEVVASLVTSKLTDGARVEVTRAAAK